MTGTIDDAFHLSEGAEPADPDVLLHPQVTEATALLEQAKGVLIFRYAIDAGNALALIERWALESGEDIGTVAHALVHDICQGDQEQPADRSFLRWLEDRLRHEFPADTPPEGGPRADTPSEVS